MISSLSDQFYSRLAPSTSETLCKCENNGVLTQLSIIVSHSKFTLDRSILNCRLPSFLNPGLKELFSLQNQWPKEHLSTRQNLQCNYLTVISSLVLCNCKMFPLFYVYNCYKFILEERLSILAQSSNLLHHSVTALMLKFLTNIYGKKGSIKGNYFIYTWIFVIEKFYF